MTNSNFPCKASSFLPFFDVHKNSCSLNSYFSRLPNNKNVRNFIFIIIIIINVFVVFVSSQNEKKII